MTEIILAIVTTIVGSEALVRLIIFFVERKDGKRGLKNQLIKLEKDSCRTQMLVMLSDYPDEKNEIMTLAEHYFKDLKGNWYMTTIFAQWLKKNNIVNPVWFKGGDTSNENS